MFVSTIHQLEKYRFGHFVLDYVKTNIPRGTIWDVGFVHSDMGDDHLYHAVFDVLSEPKKKLEFSFRVDDSKSGLPEVTFGEITWKEIS